jgi:hypothetical protein
VSTDIRDQETQREIKEGRQKKKLKRDGWTPRGKKRVGAGIETERLK